MRPSGAGPGPRAGRTAFTLSSVIVVVLGALMSTLAVATGPGLALAAKTAAPLTVQISGYGLGHGRGMGQWGAFGYASEYGWGYKQILSHYYVGTTLGALASPEPDVTVHLLELDGHNTIASALAGGELVATWAGGAPIDAVAFEVARSGGTQDVLSGPGCSGPWQPVGTTTAAVTIVSDQAGASGQAGTSPPAAAALGASQLQACIPGIGARTYQGALVARPGGGTDNVLRLEDYVDGVVPAESPVRWADLGGEAALEAQAVAARSYAVAFVASAGTICDTVACQLYTGLPDQYGPTADTEVAATAGQVLYCEAGTSCGPAGTVALAEYSASTGGYTSGGAFPAVPDIGDAVAANPVHAWTVNVAVSTLESAFPSVGTFQSIDVTRRNGLGQIGGRVEELTVIGGSGSVTLTGDQFAADLGLRSNWFEIGGSAPVTTTGPTATGPVPTGPTTTATTTPVTSTPVRTTPAAGPPKTTPTPTTPAPPGPARSVAPPTLSLGPDDGYWVASSRGGVAAFGAAASYGTAFGTSLAGQVRGMAADPDYQGYWLVGSRGGVLAFGDASWYGSASRLHLHRPIVGMVATPDGRGYWLVSQDGGIFAYGDASYHGSAGRFHLGQPIVGMAATPDGQGYWLVSRGGGVFAFGDAGFYGSMADKRLDEPIVSVVPSADGRGYFLVAKDGGVFAFGDARFTGSLPSRGIEDTVVAVTPTYDGDGYYVLAAGGRVYAFGDATAPPGLGPDDIASFGQAVAIVCHRSPRAGFDARRQVEAATSRRVTY
jgi:SpoIID/LytB domain protein